MAGRYDFSIDQGTTLSIVVTWKDANGNPVNLTGSTARMKIKKTGTGELVDSLTDTNGLTLGGAAGTITLNRTDVLTAAYDFDTANYDLEIVLSNGSVTRLIQGIVTLSKEQTT